MEFSSSQSPVTGKTHIVESGGRVDLFSGRVLLKSARKTVCHGEGGRKSCEREDAFIASRIFCGEVPAGTT
jgi:hypothetical protein